MLASHSKGAPSMTEVDLDKRVKECKYLKYPLQSHGNEDAYEVLLRHCYNEENCTTIWNLTNGTLKVNPVSKDMACSAYIEQKLHVVTTNIVNLREGYYELQRNRNVERVTKESLRKFSEGLTTTPGLLSCAVPPTGSTLAEGLTTTPGLLSCAGLQTTTAESILAGLQTTTAESILAVPPTTTAESSLAGFAACSSRIIFGIVVVIGIVVFLRKRWNQKRRLRMQDLGLNREQLVP